MADKLHARSRFTRKNYQSNDRTNDSDPKRTA